MTGNYLIINWLSRRLLLEVANAESIYYKKKAIKKSHETTAFNLYNRTSKMKNDKPTNYRPSLELRIPKNLI